MNRDIPPGGGGQPENPAKARAREKEEKRIAKAQDDALMTDIMKEIEEEHGGPVDTQQQTPSGSRQSRPQLPSSGPAPPTFGSGGNLSRRGAPSNFQPIHPTFPPRRGPRGPSTRQPRPRGVFPDSDSEDEAMREQEEKERKEARLIRVLFSGLPPGTIETQVRELINPDLTVTSVEMAGDIHDHQFLDSPEWVDIGRPTTIALVKFPEDVDTKLLNEMIAQNRNRYISHGFQVSASKLDPMDHVERLSHEAITPAFGAKELDRRARIAPGSDLPSSSRSGRAPNARLNEERGALVKTPIDHNTLKLIHMVVQEVMSSEKDPETAEQHLMEMESIKKDERFKFLYDSRSQEGLYYRWRLAEMGSKFYQRPFGAKEQGNRRNVLHELDTWHEPHRLPFEFATFPTIPAVAAWLPREHGDVAEGGADWKSLVEDNLSTQTFIKEVSREERREYLNPFEIQHVILQFAKLPTDRHPDDMEFFHIQPLIPFAMRHDTQYKHVVDLFISNLLSPCAALPVEKLVEHYRKQSPNEEIVVDRSEENQRTLACLDTIDQPAQRPQDMSNAVLIGLRVIHMVLTTTDTHSGSAGQSYKYRKGFTDEFVRRKVFEKLSYIPDKYGLNTTRAGKFREEVRDTIMAWERNGLFQVGVCAALLERFEEKGAKRKAEESLGEEESGGVGGSATPPGFYSGDQWSSDHSGWLTDELTPERQERRMARWAAMAAQAEAAATAAATDVPEPADADEEMKDADEAEEGDL